MSLPIAARSYALSAIFFTLGLVASGCERKERLLDVDTPDGGGVEVDRNIDTGAVTVDVDRVD